jgi:hypothetical protein
VADQSGPINQNSHHLRRDSVERVVGHDGFVAPLSISEDRQVNDLGFGRQAAEFGNGLQTGVPLGEDQLVA